MQIKLKDVAEKKNIINTLLFIIKGKQKKLGSGVTGFYFAVEVSQ